MYTEQMVTIPTHEYNELTNQKSKAASLIPVGATTRIPLKQYQELLINQASKKNRESKAAALYTNENKAQLIHSFITS
jgi:fibrillarin-like rRNA methylase